MKKKYKYKKKIENYVIYFGISITKDINLSSLNNYDFN